MHDLVGGTVVARSISIVLADDHALVREAVRGRLDSEADLTVVAVASNADEAASEALRLKPDVVLMDIDMPGLICFDAARTIKTQCPDTRIIFLSAFAYDRFIENTLAVEASGYVTKDEPPEAVIQAIRSALSGLTYFSPRVQSRIVVDTEGARLAHPSRSRASTLTSREQEVLRYLARGLSKKQIAQTMRISVKTVDHHSVNLMGKLDLHNRVELARYAIREGLAEM
jgi:DNA-binding NarL/FixJ family response regulator